jgi:hypothetical protein
MAPLARGFTQYDLIPKEEAGILQSWEDSKIRRRSLTILRNWSVIFFPKIAFVAALFLLLGLFHRLRLVTVGFSSTFMPVVSKRPLTVLISTADAGIGEVDYWIHNILSRLNRPINVQVIHSNDLAVEDDSIIVGFNDLAKWNQLRAKSNFKNVGLLRIGDEKGKDSSYEEYSYVLRPYWFSHIYNLTSPTTTPVLWIPNGYSTGVGPRLSSTLLPYSRRPNLCYFEGSLRDNGTPSSREKMNQALSSWDPKGRFCDVKWTGGFMGGAKPLAYSANLGRAKYALCPAGENAETIRFYEALENNAIPIVVSEPWMAGVFGNATEFPFIVLNSWDQVGSYLETLAAEDPAIGLARQAATRKWWDDLQAKIAADAARVVDVSFSDA